MTFVADYLIWFIAIIIIIMSFFEQGFRDRLFRKTCKTYMLCRFRHENMKRLGRIVFIDRKGNIVIVETIPDENEQSFNIQLTIDNIYAI